MCLETHSASAPQSLRFCVFIDSDGVLAERTEGQHKKMELRACGEGVGQKVKDVSLACVSRSPGPQEKDPCPGKLLFRASCILSFRY